MSMNKETARKIIENNNGPVIRHHIRDMNNVPVGTLVAIRVGDDIRYGWSLCNTKMDSPNKNVGTAIALNRAQKFWHETPNRINPEHIAVIKDKAARYFKGANV
jgi:hypothetical protein